MVCGSGGVGKTTISASLALAATQYRKRVLVLTIDPARRLLQAFGYSDALLQEGGEPLLLSKEVRDALGVPEASELSVAVLNPKYVIDQIIDQTMSQSKGALLRGTVIYREMSQMIHGLQEYTAYEWVTRLIADNRYDLIILDTPPAFHAKEFFNAPEKIKNLMESRVFQIFLPKTGSWFKSVVSFGWLEKVLGERLYRESTLFFETFLSLRERILERCSKLSEFFKSDTVSVIAVGTLESTPMLELEGLIEFLGKKRIPLQAVIANQVEEASSGAIPEEIRLACGPELLAKLERLREHQNAKADRCVEAISRMRSGFATIPVFVVPMHYSKDGFEILKQNSIKLI